MARRELGERLDAGSAAVDVDLAALLCEAWGGEEKDKMEEDKMEKDKPTSQRTSKPC